nr:MAG TPA: hypothetical protein [Caudoviricetes sp.]
MVIAGIIGTSFHEFYLLELVGLNIAQVLIIEICLDYRRVVF